MFLIRFLNYARDDLLGTVEVEEGGNALEQAPTPEDLSSRGLVFKYWASYGGVDLTGDLSNVHESDLISSKLLYN